MPKTTVQKVIFGLLMSFFMVLAMEMYSLSLRNGGRRAGILNALRAAADVCAVLPDQHGRRTPGRPPGARLAVPGSGPCRRSGPVRHDVRHVSAMSLWATVIFQQPGIELVPSGSGGGLQFSHGVFLADLFCGPLVRRLFQLLVPSAALYPPVRKAAE